MDAATDSKEDKVGLGVVARKKDGSVLLAASKTTWPFVSAERAKLAAFRWAIELIHDKKWSKVSVEEDAQNIVKALQGSLLRGLHSQVLVDNILTTVSKIDQISFQFCFREVNNVAHRLAKWALGGYCSNVWTNGGPTWIFDAVFSDFSS